MWDKLSKHMLKKEKGIESWANNRKETIQTNQVRRKGNQMELLEMKTITKNRNSVWD